MAVLTTEERNRLRKTQFAIPAQRKYPIEDVAHARDALARVSANGNPYQQREVRGAVYVRFPELKKRRR